MISRDYYVRSAGVIISGLLSVYQDYGLVAQIATLRYNSPLLLFYNSTCESRLWKVIIVHSTFGIKSETSELRRFPDSEISGEVKWLSAELTMRM